jgi:GDPmannose 4,6-dehydratase
MFAMMQHENPDDWVLATGETHTVKEFAEKAFNHVGLNWEDYVLTSDKYSRPNEVHHLLGDASKAKNKLGWKPSTSFDELVKKMVESDIELAKREKVLIDNGLMKPTWEYST